MELKVDIWAFNPLLPLQVLLWEVVFPWPTVTQSYKPVTPSTSEKEGIQANTGGHQNKSSVSFHS